MRENWKQLNNLLSLSIDQAQTLIDLHTPRRKVAALEYAEGGLANTNIVVHLETETEPLLLRLYVRDPQQARKEVAIGELIAGKVPSPSILFFQETNPITGHPFLLRRWVHGERLETVISSLNPSQVYPLAFQVGGALAAIHTCKAFRCAGFLDANLQISEGLDIGSS